MNEEWSMNIEERKKFWDTLCSLDGKDMQSDIKRLMDAMKFPRFLYRYRAVNDRTLTALKENKLFFSTSNYYDDPFDTYIRIDRKLVYEKIRQVIGNAGNYEKEIAYFANVLGIPMEVCKMALSNANIDFIGNASYNFFKELRNQLRKEVYSVCFSDTWKNENLWLKYADQHKGFTVAYDRLDSSLFLCGTEDVCTGCDRKDLGFSIYPVCYSDEKYDATMYARDYAVHKILENLGGNHKESLVKNLPEHTWELEKIILIKKKCHEYDAEWRGILNTPYYLQGPVCKKWRPYCVILGLNIEKDAKDSVIDAAKAAGVSAIFEVRISEDDELELAEVSDKL